MPALRRRDLLIGGAAAAAGLDGARAQPGAPGARPAAPPKELVRLAISDQTHKPFVLPLLKLIAESAGLQWELLLLPWPRALLGGELGQHLVFGLSRSPARDKVFAYSQPAFVSRGWLVVTKARPIPFERLEDLRGRTLCVSRGATYGAAFEEARRELFRVETGGNDLDTRARMLAAGRCDAMLATHRGSAAALERRLRGLRGGDQFRVLPTPLVEEGIVFGAARGSEAAALLPRLDDAIHRARAAIQTLVDSEL
ncbi:transporter substrate-binding domain-containing protein [Mitsuaria sp. GD03876]|uniref:substrate-binding periplasmic protein n=1 Tax=Mitsuaria sp. GD03876 TaxID=2975399 RepID=UPI0024471E4E|nr:transporter substrate-binding domain-containing protein [Mitsuaria sp. GD03876]MDH0865417.1 transporter substrate-binding domain-containing protein [Mitsuaria sp. GD03876]